MAKNEMFAQFKDDRLGQYISPRRIGHSTANFFQSTKPAMAYSQAKSAAISNAMPHPHRQGLKAAMGATGRDQMSAASEHIANATGLGMGTGGMIVGAMAIAGAAGAATASAATMAGPQVAVTAGVLGLVLAAKATYSNREAAHVELTKYCWSLIDDEHPKSLDQTSIKEASSAALTLIQDGQNQIMLTCEKLKAAAHNLDMFNDSIDAILAQIRTMDPNSPLFQQKRNELRSKKQAGMAQGGAIREFARRVVHTSNYIQAPHIYNLGVRERLIPGSLSRESFGDYYMNTEIGREMRSIFMELQDLYIEVENIVGV